jgi:transcriptional regulator with XRE-family HTH domain
MRLVHTVEVIRRCRKRLEHVPFVRVGNDEARYWERVFGARVKELRAAEGWTQDDFAKRVTAAGYPMHQTTVAKLESGSRPTSVGEIAALAAIFRIPIGSFFATVDDMDEDMLRRLTEASSEVGRLSRELTDHLNAQKEIRARFTEAVKRLRTLYEAAAAMPGLKHRLVTVGEGVERLIESLGLADNDSPDEEHHGQH